MKPHAALLLVLVLVVGGLALFTALQTRRAEPAPRKQVPAAPLEEKTIGVREGANISMGYAELFFPEPDLLSIRRREDGVAIEGRRFSCRLLRPTPRGSGEHDFESLRSLLRSGAKPFQEVATLGSRELEEYVRAARLRVWLEEESGGASILRNERLKAIVRHGPAEPPGSTLGLAWSHDGSLCQPFVLEPREEPVPREAVEALLESFQFTLKELPPEHELEREVHRALKRHPAFTGD